ARQRDARLESVAACLTRRRERGRGRKSERSQRGNEKPLELPHDGLFSLVMCVRVAVGAGAAEPSTAGRPTVVPKPCPYPSSIVLLAVAAVVAASRKEDRYFTATSPSWNRTRAWNRTDRR